MLLILIFSGPYSANRLVTELTGTAKSKATTERIRQAHIHG